MPDVTNPALSLEAIDFLACEVAVELYRAYCGSRPVAVRAYRDEDGEDIDALLLLLRFDPDGTDTAADGALDPIVETALRAMPTMISSAVEARTGVRLAPGNLSLCSTRGLAVFAFSIDEDDLEPHAEADPFSLDAADLRALAPDRPALRLAG